MKNLAFSGPIFQVSPQSIKNPFLKLCRKLAKSAAHKKKIKHKKLTENLKLLNFEV